MISESLREIKGNKRKEKAKKKGGLNIDDLLNDEEEDQELRLIMSGKNKR